MRSIAVNATSSIVSMRAREIALALLIPLCAGGCAVTPDPIDEANHLARLLEDREAISAMQDAPTAPITIHEAIARAIKFNLDNRLAQMESVLGMEQLANARLQMLPRLAANAGYNMRNNYSASSSYSYHTRKQSLEPSISSERDRLNGDISFSWSILDFGIGYFQAKQQADRFLILQERRRRIMNNLVKEVLTAYCRLASLEKIRPRVDEAIGEAESALAAYRKMEEMKSGPLPQTLEHQRSIIQVLGQLRQLRYELEISRSRLAALMNLPRGCDYEIIPMENERFAPPPLTASLADLEDLGVFLRSDMREEGYQDRIDRAEVKKEMIRMLPGVSIFASGNYDSNKYLVHSNWYDLGAKASMDIIGLASKFNQMQSAKTRVEVSRLRRLAGMVAAMLQIDMSYYQYRQALESYADSREMNRIDGKLYEISSATAKTRAIGRLENIMQGVTSVNTRLEMDRRMIDVLAAWANLYFSVGCDMFPGVGGTEDLNSLIRTAEEGMQRWLSGDLPRPPETAPFPKAVAKMRIVGIER